MDKYYQEIEKEFDRKWKRMRENGFGHKVSIDGRMIWDVSNENDEESAYVFVDETIKSFLLQKVREAERRGEEKALNRTRHAYCEVCQEFIDIDTGERKKKVKK